MPNGTYGGVRGRRNFALLDFSHGEFPIRAGDDLIFLCGDPALDNGVSDSLDAPQSAVVIALYLLEVLTHSSSTSVIMAIYSRSA